jgi:hypothetical protein
MLFIEWWLVERIAILSAIPALFFVAIWLVRKRTRPWRIMTMILGSPLAVLAGLFLALQLTAIGCLSYSSPLYSPDHLKAVRIRTDDEGATGGNTHVELFSKHGFSSMEVYSGQWKSVDVQDIRWLSNSELVITHDSPMYSCEGSPTVVVRCIDRASLKPN